jgi:hypothetical protein
MRGIHPGGTKIDRSARTNDFIDEEHCALCSHVWPSEREEFRANLDILPLNERLQRLLDGVLAKPRIARQQ